MWIKSTIIKDMNNTKEGNMTHLYILSLKDDCTELKNNLIPFLSVERKKKYESFRFQSDKNNCLYSYLLLKKEINSLYAIPIENQSFRTNLYGKPYLTNSNCNIFFNISHTSDCVICAISDVEVGVDIEKVRDLPEDIVTEVLSEKEKASLSFLNKTESTKRNQLFFSFWTQKEAYVKYTGKGISEGLNGIDTYSSLFKNCHTFFLNDYSISLYSKEEDYEIIRRTCIDVKNFYERL
jgi:4'-phosphopantetheinyl transferase